MSDTVKENTLSMEALVGQLGESAELSTLRQKVAQISNSKKKVSAALPRLQRERLERTVAYEESKGQVSLWNGIVVKNRNADFLRFEDAARNNFRISSNSLASKFEPTTELEKEIDIVLEKSEMKEKKVREKENEDLELNRLSIEEVRKRNQELARMKSLLFYQEQKNKRINKIKSKKYHKIHKKAEERRKEQEREMLKETDPELYRELLEKDALKRAQERMSLKHKNTSKWVKRALQHGGMSNAATREAINEQLREGERLRRRIEGEKDESDSSEEEGDMSNSALLKEAQSVLEDIDGSEKESHRGVFQMEFMKRALQRQREEARQEAEKLIQALQEEEEFNEEKEEEDSKEEKKEESEDAAKIREALKGGVVRRAKHESKSLEVKDQIAIQPLFDTPEVPSLFEEQEDQPVESIGSRLIEELEDESENESEDQSEDQSKDESGEDEALLEEEEAENPWLVATHDQDNSNKSKDEKDQKDRQEEEEIDVGATVANLEARHSMKRNESSEGPKVVIIDKESKERRKKGPTKGLLGFDEMTQESLLSEAFADAGAEKEFAESKAQVEERDEEAYKKAHRIRGDVNMDGWGSWAGIGAPEPKRIRRKEVKIAMPERSDAHLKHVIINQKAEKKQGNSSEEDVPFPFTSREQYERAMRKPLGREWNSKSSFLNLTKPEVKTRMGTIIDPIKLPKNRKNRRF